jgi:RHS repeat-associated protein
MTSATVNSVTTTFAYRGDGLRDSRTTGANTTTFTWDIAAGLPVVIDDGNRYVYGAGLEAQVSGSSTYYYLADGLGSTMAMVDDTGTVQQSYTYDVYGKPTPTGTLANEFDFAGQQTDPTGLQYLRARYMDPETGAFVSREPLAALPSWLGSSSTCVGAHPTGLVDPSGLRACDHGEPACSGLVKPSDSSLESWLNHNVPHGNGEFRVQDGIMRYCPRGPYGVTCGARSAVQTSDFRTVSCGSKLATFRRVRIKCENAFGAVLVDEYIPAEFQDNALKEWFEGQEAVCFAGGTITGGIGAVGGAAAAGPPGAVVGGGSGALAGCFTSVAFNRAVPYLEKAYNRLLE